MLNRPGPEGDRYRRRHWGKRLAGIGAGVRISEGAFFQRPECIRIGDGSWIDRNALVMGGASTQQRVTKTKPNDPFPLEAGQVSIGRGVHVSPNCVLSGIGGLFIGDYAGVAANALIYSTSAHYRNLVDPADPRQYAYTPRAPLDQQAMVSSPVYIAEYCGVGPHCLILPGTRLERGTWVAPGCVVRGHWGPQTLVSNGPGGLVEKPFTGLRLPD